MLLVEFVDFYGLKVVYGQDWTVVRELVGSTLVVFGHISFRAEPLRDARILNQLLFVLWVSTEEDTISPCRDPHLVRGIIDVAISIEFECRVEIERALVEEVQDVAMRFRGEQLIMLTQSFEVSLLHQIPHLLVW